MSNTSQTFAEGASINRPLSVCWGKLSLLENSNENIS